MTLRDRLHALPRDTRDTLFLLTVIAWIILPQVTRLPIWASALAVVTLVWRGWLALGSRPLPGLAVRLMLIVACVGGTLFTHQTIAGKDAGVTLVVVLLALKTLELRARRDAMVIFFLGFFTMLSNFFFSQSLLTAAAMLFALLGLLTALVNAHMPVGRPPLLQSMRTAGTMALLGAPIMAALFLLFPRVAPLWGVPGEAAGGRTGLSGVMRVGNIASLAMDEGVALRVRFETPDGLPPHSNTLYFRGPVLSLYDGIEWLPQGLRTDGRLGNNGAAAQLTVQGPTVRYQITMEPARNPWLLTLDAAQDKPTLPQGWDAYMTPDLLWVANRPVTEVLRYEVQSHTNFRYGPMQPTPALRTYTYLPQGFNPRTLELAQQMRADRNLVPDPNADATPALVNAALQRLRSGGYTYTLDPGIYGRHTADEFWFDRKEGFCEHIASSFVILMRALDVPARIVTGYQGGERNPVDGYWTVRQSDAHAWAEVWMAGRGWVRVDPTGAVSPARVGNFARLPVPQGAIATAVGTVISAGTLQNMRAIWEAMNNGWNQWVLNYTQGRQLDLLKSLGFESPSWEDLGIVLAGLLSSFALAGIAWSLWDRRQHNPWLRLLRRTRDRLARAGLALPETLPPRAMAQQVRAQFGDAAEPLARWLLRMEQWRYAPAPQAQQLQQLQREFRNLPWPSSPPPPTR